MERIGNNTIVIYSDSTTMYKLSDLSIGDIKKDETVTVMGKTGEDGTITVQTILLGTTLRPGGLTRGNRPLPKQDK